MSFIEMGRARPSREMVLRIGEALDLPLGARNEMLNAAGFVGAFPEAGDAASRAAVEGVLGAIMRAHLPWPAFAIDRLWSLWDADAPARRLLARAGVEVPGLEGDGVSGGAAARPNILELMFDPGGLRPLVADWPTYARRTPQRVGRGALTRADARAVLDRLSRHPGVPDDWWSPGEDDALGTVTLSDGATTARFVSVVTGLASPLATLAQDPRIETLVPADMATEATLRDGEDRAPSAPSGQRSRNP